MSTIVLKFGGSSLADNDKLKNVANKIIELYKKEYNIAVVVSAQGKTTDKLLSEAKELSDNPNKRELDVLLSSGEQISAAKLCILLNTMGYSAISLTGWQAGIYTSNTNQNALIEDIDVKRIEKELKENKIVIVTGFQGYNENMDITTFGRGGSDTSAVALAAALNAKNCYIFSDVDGVYTADPNKIKDAKKLPALSYNEMLTISNEGAKVLHDRCVEIGEKFKVPIITKSTFNNKAGTVISDIIEEETIKSVVKKDCSRISIIGNGISRNIKIVEKMLNFIENEKLEILELNLSSNKLTINFKNIINEDIVEKMHKEIVND